MCDLADIGYGGALITGDSLLDVLLLKVPEEYGVFVDSNPGVLYLQVIYLLSEELIHDCLLSVVVLESLPKDNSAISEDGPDSIIFSTK